MRRTATGNRSSGRAGRSRWPGCWREGRPWRFLADLDGGVGGELVGRHDQVERRRALSDPPRRVVDGAVARAEPAAEGAAIVARFVAERDAAEMRAYSDHDKPFRLLDPRRIRLR